MATTSLYAGGCACGLIRYEFQGPVLAAFKCHCRACQRYTGSAFMAAVLVPAQTFRLTKGEPSLYASRGDAGHEISRGFCRNCGSPVVTRLARRPDSVGVSASSMDDPSSFRPTMEIFTTFAQPWDRIDEGLRRFPEAPMRGSRQKSER